MEDLVCTDLKYTKIPHSISNEEVKTKQPIPVPYPEELFKLHTLAVLCGPRGSGKTNAAALLLNNYYRRGFFNRIFIISPTYSSNPTIQTIPIRPGDLYTDAHSGQGALRDIERKVQEAVKEFEIALDYRHAYNRWKKGTATLRDSVKLQAHKYKPPDNVPVPYCAILVDDMSHTDIYQNSAENPLINLCLRHRHVGGTKEYKVGISLFFLVQNFKTGVPKVLRENTQVFFIWKTFDFDLLLAIFQSFGNLCSREQFLHIYDEATKEPNDFLCIEPFRPEVEKRFRRNFDTFIAPTEPTTMLEIALKKRLKRDRKEKEEELDENVNRTDNVTDVVKPLKKRKKKVTGHN